MLFIKEKEDSLLLFIYGGVTMKKIIMNLILLSSLSILLVNADPLPVSVQKDEPALNFYMDLYTKAYPQASDTEKAKTRKIFSDLMGKVQDGFISEHQDTYPKADHALLKNNLTNLGTSFKNTPPPSFTR